LDEKDFILQEHRVFIRIRSGASLVASSSGVCGLANYSVVMQA
jgi:hypothetical protein